MTIGAGRRIELAGTVQGVGLRPWVYRLAQEEGVRGRVRNHSQGVSIDAFGPPAVLDSFLGRLADCPPPAAAIETIEWRAIPEEAVEDFAIEASVAEAGRRVSIPPDLATCPECLAEIFDPQNRRYGYAFTNCTRCGPRLTIARGVPYDRAATTMAHFSLCPLCREEYEDPADRRFHAQPNACPTCGPHLWAANAQRGTLDLADPVATAARALTHGLIVAVKGIGGFHLSCDATSPEAVTRLRQRKGREEKPFAVMVRDLLTAERHAVVDESERKLLAGVERPIVLLAKRSAGGLAPEVAPGSAKVGLFLPYSPLHHLLLAEADRPLVMTSGNLAEEPIARGNAEAVTRLSGIADLFLLHDREIETRCDDSVARVIAGRPVVLRRSRGWVPRPIRLARPVERPILACGAHLKNTFCLAADDRAWLGPHIGDLETAATYDVYRETIARFESFLGIRPEVIAYDLHPDYLSTRYALERPEAVKIGVQHHHAHVASALAEHRRNGPVVGLAFDGTGWGPDGTAWGGEILRADAAGYERLATLRALPLPGGETAIREVWRLALALLDQAFDGQPPLERLALFAGLDPYRVEVVRRMTAAGVNCPLARGLGRTFDAVGALLFARPEAHFEGQVAAMVEDAADPQETGLYPYRIDRSASPREIDFLPLLRSVVEDLLAGQSAGTIAGRFHNAVAAAAAEVVLATAGDLPVVATGGCLQNALLAQRLAERLAPRRVLFHHQVPPGDGGIALGQALVADAVLRAQGGAPCV